MKLTTTKLGFHFYSVFGVVFIVASVVGKTDSIADSDSAPKPNEANQDVKPYVEILSDAHAWKRLPKLLTGEEQPLPNWAKAVATQLPRTAAAMLELDAVHRTQSPLDPALRAKLRWMIAHANRCQYSEAYAIADLRRSGAMEAEVEQLVGDRAHWRDEDRDALNFVQIMTTSAPSLPDSLFSSVKDRFGDRGVAAMILLAAYGNFQDRIILGLNLPLENGGPLSPLAIKFVDGALQRSPLLPPTNGSATYLDDGKSVVPRDDAWNAISYDQLQTQLEQQRLRQPRLPIPEWNDVKSNLPAEMAARPTKIRWSLMNYGYAHELAIPWTIATRTHWAECPTERILEESLFWIQTRAIGCNYCMGHCEMLLEVAGLEPSAVSKRTRMLAETDWAAFPIAEQRAYAFARKLTRSPWELTAVDYHSLETEFGKQKAMSIFWWLCRGLYMTRVSDGFQLPLERENVFE